MNINNLISTYFNIDNIKEYDVNENLKRLYKKFDTNNFIPKNILNKINNNINILINE